MFFNLVFFREFKGSVKIDCSMMISFYMNERVYIFLVVCVGKELVVYGFYGFILVFYMLR